MEYIEAFFIMLLIALSVVQFFIIRRYYNHKILLIISSEKLQTIKKLVDSGFFDSTIFSVSKFNNWFQNNKDRDIYAHAGIYLRTDKLSRSHIDDYIKVVTKGLLSKNDFEEILIMRFEDKIRKDWIKQLNSK